MYKRLKLTTLMITIFILVSCSSDNMQQPAALVSFKPSIDVEQVWSHHTRAGRADPTYLTLQIGHDEHHVYVASPQGNVIAFDAKSGREIWEQNLKTSISSGVSVGNHIAVVTGSKGTIYALNADNGALVWANDSNEQTLGLAAIENNTVIVKTISDNVIALAANDGHVLWTYAANAPSLILRAGSAPLIVGNHVVIGFANGKVATLTLNQGSINWQQVVATPQGIFPMQRMVDIVASPLMSNGVIYDASYQGNLAALELKNGRVVWDHKLSTFTGLALSNKALFVTDADSTLLSFQPEDGGVNWRQTILNFRTITAPAVLGDYLVVGDNEGYVHWFKQKTGDYAARQHLSWEQIRATPVVINNMIYILDARGYIAAYQFNPRDA